MATAKEIIEIIDANLNGQGHVVYETAKNAGFEIALNEEGRLDLADACALVDHESAGGQNIFGCDWGARWTWEPPYCNVPVTAERVQALLRNIDEGGGQNGVGLTQLTTVGLVRQAERRGGAHLPEHQCSVGFEYLKSLVDDLGYMYGIAAYNAGPGNPQLGIDNGYYNKVMVKREKWKGLLAEAVSEPARDRSETEAEEAWSWYDQPWADPLLEPEPQSTIYQRRNPTRYDDLWRPDVERWARWLVNNFNVSCNTYLHHPEVDGLWAQVASTDPDGTVWQNQSTSLDVWGPNGRNDPIGLTVGQQIFDILFGDPGLPNINWIIWQARMWSRYGGGWQPYGSDQFTWHNDHIHVTYL